ncbi:MAG: preprotein translocase subunit YajC [Deltaproteobacteria bacterium]|nr:MAG: preprotein translocase subunit YajC [Deltaproteobacteria bacterium]
MSQLPLLVAIVAIFYFLIIRPQNQERKRHEALLAGLKKDDRVVTASGLIGKVSQVRDDRVELELAPKVRVWVEKVSIKRLDGEPAAAAGGAKEG